MAVYKVPQDVEADDKLIGPFSFRQFIYLIVVAIAMAGAWGLSTIFVPLAIIPLPIIVFFAALALPLRKDQPMEAYLTAVVSFYFLKSRKRFWIPDGIDSFVTIIPPKDADKILTKELTDDEANRRLSFLAQVVDTHGWAVRGAGATPDTSMNTDLYYEAQQATDMMDNQSTAAKAMDARLNKEADQQRQEAINNMRAATTTATAPAPTAPRQAQATPASAPTPAAANAPTAPTAAADEPPVSKLPSLAEIKQKPSKAHVGDQSEEMARRDALTYANMMTEAIAEQKGEKTETVKKIEHPVAEKAPNTSTSTPDTGTMELTREQTEELLSKNNVVSVATLGEQANHLAEQNKKLKNGDEVTISLR